MPIYDYRCHACGRRFAVFFRAFSEVTASVRCRYCGSEHVARLASRVAQLASEDARLDRLSDPSALGNVDENDPASLRRWAKRLGREMGEDLGDEFDDAMEELSGGGRPGKSEPDPMTYDAHRPSDDR